MIIEPSLLIFCAQKTGEIATDYDKYCILPSEKDGFPRSTSDLYWLVAGLYKKPIYNRVLNIAQTDAKYRSLMIESVDKCEIYYASGIDPAGMRYYTSKELFQLHLQKEELRTRDVVDLVKKMILRDSPESLGLDLGHAATSDSLGDIAAMEFLFPHAHRVAYINGGNAGRNGVVELANKYGIPPFVVQRCLNLTDSLTKYFAPKVNGETS
jgi:hypothetical protein